jgi:hypothetical protein
LNSREGSVRNEKGGAGYFDEAAVVEDVGTASGICVRRVRFGEMENCRSHFSSGKTYRHGSLLLRTFSGLAVLDVSFAMNWERVEKEGAQRTPGGWKKNWMEFGRKF